MRGSRLVFGRFWASSCFLGVVLGVVSFLGAFEPSSCFLGVGLGIVSFLERCSDQFREDAIDAKEQRISRCHDGATNLAMSRWSNEFRME